MQDKRCTLQEAIQMINDNDMITFSGFVIWRRPMAAIYEMLRQGKKGLHLVEVNSGTHAELLIGAGAVSIWESCWIGHELYGKVPYCLDRKLKEGTIIAEDYSHQHMLYRMAAGAMGIPYMPTWASRGTDILNPEYDMLERAGLRNGANDKIPVKKFDYAQDPFYNEGEVIHVPAVRPNVCIVHAQQVGEEGTIRISGQTYSDEQAIKAADRVIVLAEEIVPESYLREEPERNLVPGYLVDAIVELPWAAHPTGAYGCYDVDGAFIREFASACKTEEGFRAWVDEWVYGVRDHDEYLDKLGFSRLEKLRANSYHKYSTKVKRGSR
ncbi:glutaconate CoA-transferase subunit A [Aneurinibacillus soli]|uniref:Glutaconate CoA-transferase subunit A n=1 Tax=Aneurinibacillus soli TaxID=1500254 RepID=A0A0U5AZQ3_9BACL|nr:CoA transferase [Aneurinibacillus soli]PYE57246.1 glutaconate CoA-transferase subunit A [Aneurinibacillus soli]BAU29242.1 Glutaconate CoA-transferase subunit A [Aneurinibacillus soli]